MRIHALVLCVSLSCGSWLLCQTRKPLTNSDVVSMVKAGLADTTIVLSIERSATQFDTSPEELIKLKAAGVSKTVLEAMLKATPGPPTALRGSGKPTSSAVNRPGDKWQVTESRSPMDDSETVVLTLDAEEKVPGPVEAKLPTLIIRCKEGKTQAYVWTGMGASVESGSDDHTVRIRFDSAEAVTQAWGESDSHDSLFAPNGMMFAEQIEAASRMAFQFEPFDFGPVTAIFDVRGLKAHVGKLASACHWPGFISGQDLPAQVRSSTVSASNPEGNALMAKVVTALGGTENLARVHATRYTSVRHAKTPYGSVTLTVEITTAYPDKFYMAAKLPHGTMSMAVTADSGFTSTNGINTAMSSDVRNASLKGIKVGVLYVAQHVGDPKFSFVQAGTSTLNGKQCAVLDISGDAGDTKWCVDSATGLILRATRSPIGPVGRGSDAVYDYSNWRDIDGIKVPFRIEESGAANTVDELQTFEVNPTIDPNLFQPPTGLSSTPALPTQHEALAQSDSLSTAPCPIIILGLSPRRGGVILGEEHLLIEYKNVAQRDIAAVKFGANFIDALGDPHSSAWDYTSDQKLKPGQKKIAYWSDQVYVNELGEKLRVEAWPERVRFGDGEIWQDDGSKNCKALSP